MRWHTRLHWPRAAERRPCSEAGWIASILRRIERLRRRSWSAAPSSAITRLGTAPESSNFPPRNRIISGLTMATIVVEAGETSGALITAGFAAEQGREVFAVPGSILAPQSRGTNKLIQNGALPLLSPEDVLQMMHLHHAGEQRVARRVLPADETESKILDDPGQRTSAC